MSFAQTIHSVSKTPLIYEDADLLTKALECVPLEELYGRAEAKEAKDAAGEWGFQDYVIIELLDWFKKDFFKWVTAPKCESCDEESNIVGHQQPTADDRRHQAGVVEIYQCKSCGKYIRYPRYNSPGKLLETRYGRCGEFANCFTLLCRAVGSRARYIWNSEDHVWTEVYSEKQGRWVHADSCENAFDKPLLYGEGWGKKMAYVIGFSSDGAMDVTRRYVRDPGRALPRDKISEDELSNVLFRIISERRGKLSAAEIMQLQDENDLESAELASYVDTKPTPTETKEVGPRESGKGDWTKSRGEDGKN